MTLSNLSPYKYQEDFIRNISRKFAEGKKRVIGQAETSAGKTVIFANIANRYLQKNEDNQVLILVHREELLHQSRQTLYEWFGINARPITSDVKTILPSPVYVGMAETVFNRVRKFTECFSKVKFIICDEAHFLLFVKLFDYFPEALILGVTATPVSGDKKRPLKSIYEDIVCCIKTSELLEMKKLTPCITYHVKGQVDRKTLAMKGSDFDANLMGREFSKEKHISNTVAAYKKFSLGRKTIIFNCNTEHSRLVHEAFLAEGFNSRLLDSKMCEKDPAYRKEVMDWLRNTPDAILNNVAIAVAGLDIVSIETVIFNCSTASLAKWKQCNGRAARLCEGKDFFISIDMGGNAMTFGEWSHDIDWEKVFWEDYKPKKDGVAPIKECPNCEALIAAQATVCKFCNHEMPRNPEGIQDALPVEFELVTKNINVHELIGVAKQRNMKEYAPFFKIGEVMAKSLKNHVTEVSPLMFEKLLEQYLLKAKEWRHANGKKMNQWHRDRAKEHLQAEVKKHFPNFNVPLEANHVH